jgi:hypothetical protein
MKTTPGRPVLLSDEDWDRLPRTSADRRFVGAALAALVVVATVVAVGSATGVLVPHFTYEGGSATADAAAHTITISEIVTNHSPRPWKITGATVDAAGAAQVVELSAAVVVPAHARRTVTGLVRVEHCDALPAAPGDAGYGRSGDVHFRVQRLLASAWFPVHALLDDQIVEQACGT